MKAETASFVLGPSSENVLRSGWNVIGLKWYVGWKLQ